MATALDEFFVSLGFKVDESGARRFADSTTKAGTQTEAIAKRLKELEAQLKRVSEQFTKTAAEPSRKFAEFSQKVGETSGNLGRSLGEAARSAGLLVGTLTASFAKIASTAAETGRTARQIGTSAKDLDAIRYAAERAGIGADNVVTQLANIQRRFEQTSGQTNAVIRQLTGHDWKTLKEMGVDGVNLLNQGLIDFAKTHGPHAAEQYAKLIGSNGDYVVTLRANEEQWRDGVKAAKEYYEGAGKGQADITQKAEAFRGKLIEVGKKVEEVGKNAFGFAAPVFTDALGAISAGIDKIIQSEEEKPGLGFVSAGALAVSGLQTIVPALKTIGVNVNLLNPWMLGLAAATTLIMANWDTLGPYFETKFKQIKDAYDEGGLEAAIKETITVAEDIFKDAATWLIPRLESIATKMRSYDWAGLGKRVGEYLADGIAALFSGDETKKNLVTKLIEAFADVGRAAVGIGLNIAAGIIEGMWQKLGGKKIEELLGLGKRREEFAEGPEGEKAYLSQYSQTRQQAMAYGQQFGGGGGPPRSMQGGGIVNANLHSGEMVLPANISRGLQRLFSGGDAPAFAQQGAGARADEKLQDWLSGQGRVPTVKIDEESIASAFVKGAAKLMGIKGVGVMGAAMKGGQRLYRDVSESMEEGMGPLGAVAQELLGVGTERRAARAGGRTTAKQQQFIDMIRPHAEKASAETGISANVIMAQAILESGWGTSRAAREQGNLFGIKRPGGTSGYATHEGGIAGSFAAYARLMQHERYREIREAKGEEAQLAALFRSPYEETGYAASRGQLRSLVARVQGGGAGPVTGQEGLQGDYAQRMGWSQQQAAQNLVSIKTASGASFRVHRAAAPQFQGLLNELEAGGYYIDPKDFGAGGFNPRQKVGGGKGWSSHAYGTAIDVNPARNPLGGKGHDFPSNIGEIAARHGLRYGGAPGFGIYDPHHFELATLGGPSMNGGTINNNGNNRNVTMTVANNVYVQGGALSEQVGRFQDAQRRALQDTQRDLQGAIA